MNITFEKFTENDRYHSLLVINDKAKWNETLYFTYYTPWEEENQKLYAGKCGSEVHKRQAKCECVMAFDFHKWDEKTLEKALKEELPPVAFKQPLEDLLKKALEQRDSSPDGFTIKVKN